MTYRILLLILILAALIAACDWEWWNVGENTAREHLRLQTATAYEATRQLGATAWAVQQTEIAEESEK